MSCPREQGFEPLTDALSLDILKFVITELGSGNREHHGLQLGEDACPAWTHSCY